jgi:hypothetical protein
MFNIDRFYCIHISFFSVVDIISGEKIIKKNFMSRFTNGMNSLNVINPEKMVF